MTEPTVVRKSVALEPIDIEIVEALVENKGLGAAGFSAGLRMIIREWVELKEPRFLVTDAGRQALETARADGDG